MESSSGLGSTPAITYDYTPSGQVSTTTRRSADPVTTTSAYDNAGHVEERTATGSRRGLNDGRKLIRDRRLKPDHLGTGEHSVGLASLLHAGTVLIAERFVDELLAAAPQAGVLVTDNRDPGDGKVLLHLLLPDLLRLAVSAFRSGDVVWVTRILAVTERGLRDGDEYVRNAVALSFVEHFGASPR